MKSFFYYIIFYIEMATQKLIDTSFLEVSINSNRLMSMLDQINKKLAEHTSQIISIKALIPNLKSSFQSSIDIAQKNIQKQIQIIEENRKAENQRIGYQKKSMMMEIKINQTQCLEEIKEKSGKINVVQNNLRKLEHLFENIEVKYENVHMENQQKIKTVNKLMENLKYQIDNIDLKFCEEIDVLSERIRLIPKNYVETNPPKPVQRKKSQIRTALLAPKKVENQQKRVIRSPSMNRSHFSNMTEKTEYVAKPKQMSLNQSSQILSELSQESVHKTDLTEDDYENQSIHKQLDELTNEIDAKIASEVKNLNLQIQNLKTKTLILDEKAGINGRKMEKESQKIADIKLHLKKLEEKTSNQEQLDEFKRAVAQYHNKIDKQMENKVGFDQFEKDQHKMNEKIIILHQNITEKADRTDMKKGFNFVEQKLKQIIILIAGEQNQQKDGAIRKIPAKCLSCDKQVESQNKPQTSMPNSPRERKSQVSRSKRRKILLSSL